MNLALASPRLREFMRHSNTRGFLHMLAGCDFRSGPACFGVLSDWVQDFGIELELPITPAEMQLFGEFMDRSNRHQMLSQLRGWASDLLRQLGQLKPEA